MLMVHGTIVLLLGLLLGFPFLQSIVRQAPARRTEAWRAAHTGLSGTGVMGIAMGAALQGWSVESVWHTATLWGITMGAYGIALAMTLAAFTGARGLAAGGNLANRVVWVSYMVGVPATLVGCCAFLGLAWQQATGA